MLRIFISLFAVLFITGCASSPDRSDRIAELLREIDQESATYASSGSASSAYGQSNIRGEGPDRADSGLPLLPRPSYASSEGVGSTASGDSGYATSARPSYGLSGSEITIQPGCLLRVSVQEDPGLDGNYAVNDIGAIDLGYIGPIILMNKTVSSAARKITEVLTKREFRSATVAVKIIRASYDKVRVDGDVNNPGDISIGAGDTISLNDALLRVGGIRASAKGAKVKVVRGGLMNAMVHALKGEVYSLVSENGTPAVPNVVLKNNDVATVFSSVSQAITGSGEKEITVLGEVKRPGIFKFTNGEPCTVMHLMFKVGELPLYANKKAVKIYRKNRRGFEEEFEVDVEKIMTSGMLEDDVPLEHGDRVVVPARRLSIF